MDKVLTDGKTNIGAYKFPDRKKVALCIEKGNEIKVYIGICEASDMVNAISALEKQIPKKIVTKGHFEFCPNCIITTLKRIVVNAVKNFCGRVIQND